MYHAKYRIAYNVKYSLEVVYTRIDTPEMYLKIEDSFGNSVLLDPLVINNIPTIYKRLIDNRNKK